MQIPLDYYRILGVPIQATVDQLGQAYEDRTLQLPRREYSEAAIDSRKSLLSEAYEVLSDSERRAQYDANFLTTSYELESSPAADLSSSYQFNGDNSVVESRTPSIEIDQEQLAGALIILQELGEYELVLNLGKPILSSLDYSTSAKGTGVDPKIARADIVLTLAVACLELGREQWQQGQYEQAALSGQTGQELLLQEGLFPSVRGEIKADLYRLRPYRILELVALEEKYRLERRKGLQILQEMLQERGGIDGTQEDESGLSIDDFLRFIQQLRSYLTAAEQQELFEAEARRPSAVATYLAVYALLGRGFAERQPAYIARAKEMLVRLGHRQDVHLEQAVCALLLGQTEEATRALELSQEYEPLAFIREHSVDSPDLLPGLCLYGERWLQNEVFPHFRDLSRQQTSLKEYFADEQVQAYLENLPTPELPQNDYATANGAEAVAASFGDNFTESREEVLGTTGATATAARPSLTTANLGDGDNLAPNSSSALTYAGGSVERNSRRQRHNNPSLVPVTTNGDNTAGGRGFRKSPRTKKVKLHSRNNRWVLFALFVLLILGGAGFIIFGVVRFLSNLTTGTNLERDQPGIELSQPPISIPPQPTQVVLTGPLTGQTAQKVIEVWLDTKRKAMGREHKVELLSQILAEPSLSSRRQTAQRFKSENYHMEYQHSMKVQSVSYSDATPNRGTVEVAVREIANAYQGGRPQPGDSYNSNLRVRYNLVRQGGRWLIRDWRVL